MNRILYCIALEHDWRWTLAAALVCVIGIGTALRLLGHAREMSGHRRRNTALLAAFVGGLAIFSTHFLAMQGYQAGGEIRYGVWPTLASLVAVLGSFILAAGVVLVQPRRASRAIGAILAMAGVAAMHFIGIAALEMSGEIVWRPELVVLAIVGGMTIAGLAGAFVYGPGLKRLIATTLSGAAAVVVLHFVSMSAMTVIPRAVSMSAATVSGTVMTGVLVAMVAGIVTIAAMIAWMSWIARSSALGHVREAIDAMPDGLAFYDADDRLVLWNHRYAEVNPELSSTLQAGMTFREIIQIGLGEGLYADAVGREEAWIAERLESRKALSNTMEQHIAGDRWLRVADRRTAAGGIVTVCTDITDLKHGARSLAEARDAAQAASTAKSQFLANMSHEIRTPLNGVIGVAQALARTDLSSQQQEMLQLIQSSGQTLQVLLSDILDLARVESGRLELADDAFDLGRAVREAAQLYETSAEAKGLQFFVEIAPEADRWISGDPVRIKQILTNLVSNAVKFTNEGFVSLTAAPGPDHGAGPTLRFSIEDTGIGFDSDTRERLFSRFEQADGAITRRFGGSGLGLAISRQLAEMMGGDLDCESEPGGGSAFILTIPFRPVEMPTAAVPAAMEARDDERPAIRVLLADDHPVNRKVVEMILAQADVELTAVENGAEALQACRDADFDLILMDMQMPVMDGLTATREIRLHEAAMGLDRTAIVMLTANALPEHIASAEAAGADRHLAKPFDAAELLGLVETLPNTAIRIAA
ncbi:ATP-binding protein [Brevundimonas sp.]|uniref:ATP-binding protein n=1 Tax=Brevundimonas sp. TaxID=1871086 RepID=UPI002737804B|nr:ATP-binding protein [Brevundimonas sp.]MDP3801087.1 ATP-binding protein [Brevundimonas sp.]